jgi:hypothetical protein
MGDEMKVSLKIRIKNWFFDLYHKTWGMRFLIVSRWYNRNVFIVVTKKQWDEMKELITRARTYPQPHIVLTLSSRY